MNKNKIFEKHKNTFSECWHQEIDAITLLLYNDSSTPEKMELLNDAKEIIKSRAEQLYQKAEIQ